MVEKAVLKIKSSIGEVQFVFEASGQDPGRFVKQTGTLPYCAEKPRSIGEMNQRNRVTSPICFSCGWPALPAERALSLMAKGCMLEAQTLKIDSTGFLNINHQRRKRMDSTQNDDKNKTRRAFFQEVTTGTAAVAVASALAQLGAPVMAAAQGAKTPGTGCLRTGRPRTQGGRIAIFQKSSAMADRDHRQQI